MRRPRWEGAKTAESDWAIVDSSLTAAQVARGVSSAFTPPNGAGLFTLAMDSRSTTTGAVAFFTNRPNFAPLLNAGASATGGSLRFAVRKETGGAATGWAAFGFIGLRSGAAASPNPSVNDTGYLFGLEDASPYRIACRKGTPVAGLPSTAGATLLRASTATFTPAQWHHLRVDMIVNPNGDVVLRFFQNDLVVNPVTTPVWAAIAGMTDYTDDALGILSGSAPLSGGFVGFGMWSNTIGRRAFIDHVECMRQV